MFDCDYVNSVDYIGSLDLWCGGCWVVCAFNLAVPCYCGVVSLCGLLGFDLRFVVCGLSCAAVVFSVGGCGVGTC